ncbi:MAG TPA: hypothetical protein VFG20_16910 [Planctomycetaceae bacterium]|jgi:hypothetical protein|nr:hypothetical protein [Planctomycetaceae bacterium]
MTPEEISVHEFNELSSALRHYSALRFAILTLFFAVTGGNVTFLYGTDDVPLFVIAASKLAGIVVTVVLWYFEYRIQDEFLHLERRLASVESKLGYDVYTRRSRYRFNLFWLTSLLYGVVLLFWLVSLFFWRGPFR